MDDYVKKSESVDEVRSGSGCGVKAGLRDRPQSGPKNEARSGSGCGVKVGLRDRPQSEPKNDAQSGSLCGVKAGLSDRPQSGPKNEARSKSRLGRLWFVLPALLIMIASALLAAARMVPGFAEWYSSNIYPLLQGSVGRLSGIFPFSVAELLCLLLPLILFADIVRCLLLPLITDADTVRRRQRFTAFFRHLILLVSTLVFLYAANCGVNYYRDPFVDPEVYSDAEFTVEQLAEFCEYIAEQLRNSSEGTEILGSTGFSANAGSDVDSRIIGSADGSADVDGLASDDGELDADKTGFDYPDNAALAAEAVSAMQKLGSEYERLSGFYPRPKRLTILSGFFSQMGVSGIYSPFTIEANINGEMPEMENPFTACHELSHLKGFMNEGEANYIGWLACIGSDDAAFRRSGWLIAWSYAGSSLRRVDPDRYDAVLSSLPDDALQELRENHEFWESHETKASEVQDKVNDAYLKSNGQTDGISSYGMLTTLMLVWFLSA